MNKKSWFLEDEVIITILGVTAFLIAFMVFFYIEVICHPK